MVQKINNPQARKSRKSSRPILHEVEIIYNSPRFEEPIQVKTSLDGYNLLMQSFDKRKIDFKEMFYVVLLNNANYCLGYSHISTGSTSGTVVNIKEIFQLAIKTNASAIILAHNHPSGSLKPSEADLRLTRKIKDGCELLDMKLLDHLIITSLSYYSFTDNGHI